MTAATFTPAAAPAVPRPHRLGPALRALRAFGGAAVAVALLGAYDERSGVRGPRPEYGGALD
ncbi:hypothetical protein [Streptomyces purpureus]|uniref:Uncharacterized protein n=1 Tax=Streptomyces purpureus TaxID=1951 RepID=A0A918H4A6_9ACTN|nr:hypothetical protein [Streptomyces purpureus]GGT37046.1 hypothetical protein GCM10014713_33500 [Streptomyces purpureus]